DDHFNTGSVTICPFTTDPTDAPLLRLQVEPSTENGLHERSKLMVDKITTVSRAKLGDRAGRLTAVDTIRLNRAIFVFLGLSSAG
ncbi:MAG TPA: type II toxin-antitoxin system PemK/MazF family toxin, partial [Solirubrobacteraceae bacterium]|nr:type II toxin-antitoxin system PemK/MazF family toxin [Solirubrobacteraceae bacterium]